MEEACKDLGLEFFFETAPDPLSDVGMAGARWSAARYVDPGTGTRLRNAVLVNQDIYILGRGYQGITEVEVPEKYLRIGR